MFVPDCIFYGFKASCQFEADEWCDDAEDWGE